MRAGRVGERAESDGEAFSERCPCYYITYLPTYRCATHLNTGTGLQRAL